MRSILAFLLLGSHCAPLSAQVTERVSVDSQGVQGNSDSGGDGFGNGVSISADGRYVAFDSEASNLVPGDTNLSTDVFVHDRLTGRTQRVSLASGGVQVDRPSYYPSISADGRFVAFVSEASDLVPGDTNGHTDVFVHDRQTGTTERVSIASNGSQADGYSFGAPSITADGRFVTFASWAGNLVPGDTNGLPDVFVHDRETGLTERASVASGGAQGSGFSETPSISGDGRYVTFESDSSDLVPGDTNGGTDIFVRDRRSGTTERVSVVSNGAQANSFSRWPSISANGRFFAFVSWASNLVPGDSNGSPDVFVHDLQTGMTELVSLSSSGVQGDFFSSLCSINADGRYVAFESQATNLVPSDTNGVWDVFIRDRQRHVTERASISTLGIQCDANCGNNSGPVISADGRYVAFDSSADNLVPGDTLGANDVFVHDREATGFMGLCDPAGGGVIGCPCSNPPSGADRGCDNSLATGGAALFAYGIAYVSIDSLVFTTDGELPSALSILIQGNALLAHGTIYGQGVRCVGGTTKRLFTKTAAGGSITAPDFPSGDPTVSARSAAKGDVIQPGQSRWYLVYYRDPIVLGGCPASATFNATQTGQVTWWP